MLVAEDDYSGYDPKEVVAAQAFLTKVLKTVNKNAYLVKTGFCKKYIKDMSESEFDDYTIIINALEDLTKPKKE